MKIQSPAAKTIEAILWLHDFLTFFIVVLSTLIAWFLIWIIFDFDEVDKDNKDSGSVQKQNGQNVLVKFLHHATVEAIWTIIPVVLLTFIAYPSLQILFDLDMVANPGITYKIVGSQWYWSYEVPPQCAVEEVLLPWTPAYIADQNQDDLNYDLAMLAVTESRHNTLAHLTTFRTEIEIEEQSGDSYLMDADELSLGLYRLLEGDSFFDLPINVEIRFIITASDVLHSFAIPALGIKLDAVPGRLNQFGVRVRVPGVYYGQCSELCGVGHGFMPIKVTFIDYSKPKRWTFF